MILLLLVTAGAALYFSQSRVSSLVEAALGIEAAAEELLTRAVGTEVTIESIDVALADGELSILGLTVANPAGFHTPHALEASEVRVAMELASLLEDTVVVREIVVEKPLLSYEVGPDGSNLEALQRNAESFAGSGAGTSGGAPTRRILIENLHVRGGRVAASAVFLEGKSWKVPLPDIHLRNLSSGEGGIAAAGVVKEVTAEIARNARRSVAPIRELAGEIEEPNRRQGVGGRRESQAEDREGVRERAGDPGTGVRIRPRGLGEGNGEGQERAGEAPRKTNGMIRGNGVGARFRAGPTQPEISFRPRFCGAAARRDARNGTRRGGTRRRSGAGPPDRPRGRR